MQTVVNAKMEGLGKVRSAIRDIFEYGNARRAEIGAEKVFDFSLGNPSVPAPDSVNEAVADLARNFDSVALHGYTSAVGDAGLRQAIADNINSRFSAGVSPADIYVTCGAAASLAITIRALACEGDEFMTIAPFFPEYRVFVEAAGCELNPVPADENTFRIDENALRDTFTPRTKGIIINSPNNPTGVIFGRSAIDTLCRVLREKSAEYGHPIFLISDEPYRELVYDDIEVPYLINEYDDTIVCYSFSKSLSLPGERIGYIVVSSRAAAAGDIYAAVCGAGRALGYVCAPSTMQRVIRAVIGQTSDVEVYRTNRDLLYDGLSGMGFTCVHPDGAFYLFMKSPEPDAKAFCERAKKYEILMVPSDSFGVTGYVRIAYCVSTDMIRRSLPAFRQLAEEYGLC